MERLPGEMIAEIGRYLSVADLVACSATCRTWREMINEDRIWRRCCTLQLAEYLENTDTTVSPVLQLTGHDSLSPLCEWRTRFIRENHLWNNWRQGYYRAHKIASINKQKLHTKFYENDYMIMALNGKVSLWDVRDVPTCLMRNPCRLDPNWVVDYFEVLTEDRIIFIQLAKVSVFRMSITSRHWPLILSFYFNERFSTADFRAEDVKTPHSSCDSILPVPASYFYTITGDNFVGVTPGFARLLHVWNIKTGDKLKEVVCPVSNPDSFFTRIYHSHKPSPDVVLVALEDRRDDRMRNVGTHVYVFNASELRFRDFIHTLTGRVNELRKCMIEDPYVFVKDYFFLTIFNYKTSSLVKIDPALSNPTIFNNNVIYVSGKKFMEFNVSTGQTNELSTFEAYPRFTVTCDRFIITQPHSVGEFEVLEVNRSEMRSEFITQPNNSYWLFKRKAKTNPMCTKKIIIEFDGQENKRNVHILNFW